MQTVTLARNAMATRFELVLHGENPTALRAAGEAALDEIDRLENQLSLYRPGSEIAQINDRAAREPVRITPPVFALLQQAKRISEETGGAFDITIAPLVRCWGFMGARRSVSWEASPGWSSPAKIPTADEVAEARARIGMHHVQLDPRNRTVRFDRDGVMLDLGAIGKGYAVDQAAEILRDAGVMSALIHGGTSTVYAIGRPPGGEFWAVGIETPPAALGLKAFPELPTAQLRDEAMSISAMWGRSFESGQKTFGHVIDPRTGEPVGGSLLAMVVLPSATETDALSTALLTLGSADHESINRLRSGMSTLLVTEVKAEIRAETKGIFTSSKMPVETARRHD